MTTISFKHYWIIHLFTLHLRQTLLILYCAIILKLCVYILSLCTLCSLPFESLMLTRFHNCIVLFIYFSSLSLQLVTRRGIGYPSVSIQQVTYNWLLPVYTGKYKPFLVQALHAVWLVIQSMCLHFPVMSHSQLVLQFL